MFWHMWNFAVYFDPICKFHIFVMNFPDHISHIDDVLPMHTPLQVASFSHMLISGPSGSGHWSYGNGRQVALPSNVYVE